MKAIHFNFIMTRTFLFNFAILKFHMHIMLSETTFPQQIRIGNERAEFLQDKSESFTQLGCNLLRIVLFMHKSWTASWRRNTKEIFKQRLQSKTAESLHVSPNFHFYISSLKEKARHSRFPFVRFWKVSFWVFNIQWKPFSRSPIPSSAINHWISVKNLFHSLCSQKL